MHSAQSYLQTAKSKGHHMKYNIRILKAGLISFDSDVLLTKDNALEIAQNHLDGLSDEDIIESFADFAPKAAKQLGTRFDSDSLEIHCVEDCDTHMDYTDIYQTQLWSEYAYGLLSKRIEELLCEISELKAELSMHGV